jgi:cell wall-associated NlpC family hydrolase
VAPHAPRAPMPRSHRKLRAMALVAAVAVGLVLTQATAGYAAPSPSPVAAPGDIEAQIDATWNTLEPMIEQYNAVHGQRVAMQAKVDGLENQIKPLQIQVDLAMTRVGAISAQAYMFGPGSKINALLEGSDPATFVDNLTTLDEIARHEQATVADVAKLADQYQQQKRPLDDALAALKKQDDQLAAQKAAIEAKIQQLNSMRLTAYGNGQGTGSLRPVTCPQVYTGDRGSKAAQYACQQIGKPYVWAADGPKAYDCSGLTEAAWRSVGVSLPHNALEQKYATPRVASGTWRPGDLIFYYGDVHHVVIYVGNNWVVSAPTFGESVQMQKLDMGRYNSAGRPG